jgi:hypothetical protein
VPDILVTFWKKFETSNFTKIRPAAAEFSMLADKLTDGQTDREKFPFRNFTKAPKSS